MIGKLLVSSFSLCCVAAAVHAQPFAHQPIIAKAKITSPHAAGAPATKDVYLMNVKLTSEQKTKLQAEVSPFVKSDLPSNVDLGMNNVPVLDQGWHGTCVTFAVTAALDALLGKGDYVSQLCSLELGNYLEKRGYFPSGWDGTWADKMLNQIQQFGIVSLEDQKTKTCAGIKEYPAYQSNNTGNQMSLNEYKNMSENLSDFENGKFFMTDPIFTYWQRFGWKSGDDNRAVNTMKHEMTLNFENEKEKYSNRMVVAVMLPFEHCIVGACAKYHADFDTWAYTKEIKEDKQLSVGGHEMVLIGYDDNAVVVDNDGVKHRGIFILRNSWGDDVGDHGNYYMTYEFFKHFATAVDSMKLFEMKSR